MGDVVNISDYQKRHEYTDITNLSQDAIQRLLKDILETPNNIQDDIRDAGLEFTRNVINLLHTIGADPEDEILSDDMIFISMLFSSALEEYYTAAYERNKGNEFYRYLIDMKEGIFE